MKAYELLSSPEKWTKGAYARDEEGVSISCKSPEAVQFCSLGAIERCYPNNPFPIMNKLDAVIKSKYGNEERRYGLVTFNDAPETTYEQVIEVLKEADV
jgi:hypothetical protein